MENWTTEKLKTQFYFLLLILFLLKTKVVIKAGMIPTASLYDSLSEFSCFTKFPSELLFQSKEITFTITTQDWGQCSSAIFHSSAKG